MVLPAQAVLAAEAQGQEIEEVVVTGFRGSLNTALSEKRSETAAVDVIAAEDIGKFPDSNLAESMQRIPGVALTRSDGGEGRNIAVRGLGAQFTQGAHQWHGRRGADRLQRHLRRGQQRPQLRLQRFPHRDLLAARRAQDDVGRRRGRLAGRHGGSQGSGRLRLRPRPGVLFHGPWHLERSRSGSGSARLDACVEEILRQDLRRAADVLLPGAPPPRGGLLGGGHPAFRHQRQRPSAPPRRPSLPFCTPDRLDATGPSPHSARAARRLDNCSQRSPAASTAHQRHWRRSTTVYN